MEKSKQMPLGLALALGTSVLLLASSSLVFAKEFEMPTSFFDLTVSETVPEVTPFEPLPLSANDFKVVWDSQPPFPIEVTIDSESLEWVRVRETMVLPRGKVMIRGNGEVKGQVRYQGFAQPLLQKRQGSRSFFSASQLVALASHPSNLVSLYLEVGNTRWEGSFHFVYQPAHPLEDPVAIDSSCSNYRISLEKLDQRSPGWGYMACRMTYVHESGVRKGQLEVLLYLDSEDRGVSIDGFKTPESVPGVWNLRLQSEPGVVHFLTRHLEFDLRYSFSPVLHSAYVGAGIGPYLYSFQGGGYDVSGTVAPVLTLYASYFINEATKLVLFDATAFHRAFFSDFGVYVLFEQGKFLDDRATLGLLLGGHGLIYPVDGVTRARPSFPQGFEFTFKDFLLRRHHLSMGAFLFPDINSQSYYNGWVRWGTSIFGEVNFIAWKEKISGDHFIQARSVGLTIGFPVARFFY